VREAAPASATKDLVLGIYVQRKKAESGECRRGMAGRKAHLRFFNLASVAATDLLGLEEIEVGGYTRIADVEEVRPQATDQDFDQGLEQSCCRKSIAETNELIYISNISLTWEEEACHGSLPQHFHLGSFSCPKVQWRP